MVKAPTPSLIVLKPLRQSSILLRRKIHQWEVNVHFETWRFQLGITLQGSKIMIWNEETKPLAERQHKWHNA